MQRRGVHEEPEESVVAVTAGHFHRHEVAGVGLAFLHGDDLLSRVRAVLDG
jgi:hypothetical protein